MLRQSSFRYSGFSPGNEDLGLKLLCGKEWLGKRDPHALKYSVSAASEWRSLPFLRGTQLTDTWVSEDPEKNRGLSSTRRQLRQSHDHHRRYEAVWGGGIRAKKPNEEIS